MANVGGQAVLEGVMMRGPSSWAVAVRRPDGRISEIEHDVESVALRRRWLRLPVVRGIVALGEALAIGNELPPLLAPGVADALGDGRLEVLTGVTHFAPMEDGALVARSILDHLAPFR